MRQLGKFFRPARLLAGVALLIAGVSAAGAIGCSLMLDTDVNPYRCVIDSDCARYPNAVCDTLRKECVPRLPSQTVDSGASTDTGGGAGDDASALTCELAFDNRSRIPSGPDGGLLPLPEGP
jgi:hypothetical protein